MTINQIIYSIVLLIIVIGIIIYTKYTQTSTQMKVAAESIRGKLLDSLLIIIDTEIDHIDINNFPNVESIAKNIAEGIYDEAWNMVEMYMSNHCANSIEKIILSKLITKEQVETLIDELLAEDGYFWVKLNSLFTKVVEEAIVTMAKEDEEAQAIAEKYENEEPLHEEYKEEVETIPEEKEAPDEEALYDPDDPSMELVTDTTGDMIVDACIDFINESDNKEE